MNLGRSSFGAERRQTEPGQRGGQLVGDRTQRTALQIAVGPGAVEVVEDGE